MKCICRQSASTCVRARYMARMVGMSIFTEMCQEYAMRFVCRFPAVCRRVTPWKHLGGSEEEWEEIRTITQVRPSYRLLLCCIV